MPHHRTNARDARAAHEQRQEERHVVDIHGELRSANAVFPVDIVGLSNSGALVLIEMPPQAGEDATLWIEDFGTIPVKVIHAGEFSCGLAVTGGAAALQELLAWAVNEPMKES